MAHPRKLIRQAVVALLRGVTDAGDRVQGTRVDPSEESELPALAVYTLNEPIDGDSVQYSPRRLKRTLELEVVGWVAHKDSYSVDDAMDDLAEQVEMAMESNRWFGLSFVDESILTGTVMEVVEPEGRSDPSVGIVVLTYTVTYWSEPMLASATPTDDFLRADAKHKFVGSDDANRPEDTFSVRTP